MSTANGQILRVPKPPKRVVSLVPSMTESLFDLGLGDSLVGITDYCVHPAQKVAGLPRVGGTKNPRLEEIRALDPDLVIANKEENTPETIRGLEAAGLTTWVTFPQTVRQALETLNTLIGFYGSQSAFMILKSLEQAVDWAEAAGGGARVRYFCPIWYAQTSAGQPWWMAFNRETYSHDLLALFGGENVFAARERRYPLEADIGGAQPVPAGERDTRYPRVPLEEVRAAAPELILLPTEPFEFTQQHADEIARLLPDCPAVRAGRVHLVDGSLITWHGTRIARALRRLPELFAGETRGQ